MNRSWLASVRTGLISHPDRGRGYVRVECPVGYAEFPACTADRFDDQELTIADSDGLELRTFTAGSWLSASVFDPRGNPLYSIIAGQPAESRTAS